MNICLFFRRGGCHNVAKTPRASVPSYETLHKTTDNRAPNVNVAASSSTAVVQSMIIENSNYMSSSASNASVSSNVSRAPSDNVSTQPTLVNV